MMKRYIIAVAVLPIVLMSLYGQAASFPFVGAITTNNVNIRAGQSRNFEALGQLNRNDQVIVVEKSYGWYKIKLPSFSKSYIIAKYVQLQGKIGIVTADEVNVRSKADVEATSLCQIAKGRQVEIVEKLEGWYKIIPPEGCFGWISEQFISFKSSDLTSTIP